MIRWTLLFIALAAVGFAGAWLLGEQLTQAGRYFVLVSGLLLIALLFGLAIVVRKGNL